MKSLVSSTPICRELSSKYRFLRPATESGGQAAISSSSRRGDQVQVILIGGHALELKRVFKVLCNHLYVPPPTRGRQLQYAYRQPSQEGPRRAGRSNRPPMPKACREAAGSAQ